MEEQELREVMNLLLRSGLPPMLCDTPVLLANCPAHCGIPTEPGDLLMEDYMLLPKALVGQYPEICIPATGDSMKGVDFCEGDRLHVRLGMPAHDGDIVLASIDQRCTVKILYTDSQGRKWLVPSNDNYAPILLTEEMDVRLLGVVVDVVKRSPRADYGACQRSVNRALSMAGRAVKPADGDVDKVIGAVAGEVKNGRQWYAVYRSMADRELTGIGRFGEFCGRIARVVPAHDHLPVAKELGRMAVQSFRKRVALWNADDAPVNGQRFADYLHIALLTGELLDNIGQKTPTNAA